MSISRIVQFAGLFGLYSLARRLTRNHPRILMYHRFSTKPKGGFVCAAEFERQVAHIVQHYNAMTLGELVTLLRSGGRPPPNTLVITVDDGYKDFHEVAWPILRKHHAPATLFATTGFVDRELWLWPDQVSWLLKNGDKTVQQVHIAGRNVSCVDNAWQTIIDIMLGISEDDKQQAIRTMAEQLHVALPITAPPEFSSVTWDQLLEMQAGGVEIGGHTHTHPTLPKVSSDKLSRELIFCLARLTDELGERYRPFCYPNGQPTDYNREVRDAVEAAGFSCSVLAYADHRSHGDLYVLGRHSSSANHFQFLKASSGLEWIGQKIRAWRATE